MWKYRIIIPQSLRVDLLEELHGAHLGVVKMNALVRFYFWWLGLDRDIEEITKTYKGCLECADDSPQRLRYIYGSGLRVQTIAYNTRFLRTD